MTSDVNELLENIRNNLWLVRKSKENFKIKLEVFFTVDDLIKPFFILLISIVNHPVKNK